MLHGRVTPSGTGLAAAPRPADCQIEFLRSKRPDRAYDEIAALHASGTSSFTSPGRLQEAVRSKACSVGADAVIVTQDFVPPPDPGRGAPYMTGTAIKYREGEPPAPSASK